MRRRKDNSGCAGLLIIIVALWLGGGILGALGILAVTWLIYLVLIGVSIGIVMAIVKVIGGK